MTEMILIRHGETDWNRELRFQGQVDVPLNHTGLTQARRVADRMAGESIHHVYSSDLIRTRQTALPSAQLLSLSGVDEAGLREQNFGMVDGMRVADIKAQYPQEWLEWLKFSADYLFTGGESTRSFHARVSDAVSRLAAAHIGKKLLVVTHGGVLDMIYRSAMALPLDGPRQSQIPNGGISRVRVDGEKIEILGWADVRHLDGLPPQPVYEQSRAANPLATSLPLLPSGFGSIKPA
ncbi:MAG: histidine phosphatase family protein [Burkholderiales bacterium]